MTRVKCPCPGLLTDGAGNQDHGADGAPCFECGHRSDEHEPPPAGSDRGGRYVCNVMVPPEPLGYATNYDELITLADGQPNPERRRPFTDEQLAQLYYENLVVALRAMVERR